MKAIIIDDVALAIESLSADLADYCPEIELIGTAGGVVNGAKLLKEVKPDLIFLDVEMQDGNGFDLLDIVGEQDSHVIFTTGSKDYAIKAFQYTAADYLLKPIDPDLLVKAVAKLSDNAPKDKVDQELLKAQLSTDEETIALNTQEEITLVQLSEIIRCESMDNYTRFHLADKSKILVTKTLKNFENILPSDRFLRVHQSHLVNLEQIKSYVKTEGGYLMMRNGDHVSVSVRKKPVVMEILLKQNLKN